MREGMDTEYGVIIKVDYEKNVIVTRDFDDEGYDDIRFLYILNPSTKPSLYNTYRAY